MGDEARCPEPEEPADDAEELKPGKQTDARDAEAEHVVSNGGQVSSPGGRRGGQVTGRVGSKRSGRS